MMQKFHLSKVFVLILSLVAIIAIASSFSGKEISAISPFVNEKIKDSIASVAAFKEVYKVLMSPRCLNCHPAGDIPLQGDDSHLHAMEPKRGKDGKGLYAMKCGNCHQATNAPGLHTPPGNPKWQLPPPKMKMVFEGKSARELALQIKDFNKNGNKNKQQLLLHARDTLVKAAWNMGEGRTAPPLSYKAFLLVWDTWIEKGGYAPAK